MIINKDLVSIAMATYNGEKYLKEQLDSLINQSYKSIEIVIVDDCSKDNTIGLIKQYQEKFNFIRLFINEKNILVPDDSYFIEVITFWRFSFC